MSLRDTLRETVARCTPQGMQHATIDPNRATGDATVMQQTSSIPHEIRVLSATAIATAMQQGAKRSATFVHQEQQQVAPVAGALTAHRLAKELIAAAMKRCDEFNDSEAAREQMRRDCLELSPELQADLLEHFRGKPQGETNDEF